MEETAIITIHGHTVDDLILTALSHDENIDEDRIRYAFEYAKKAHGDQKRKSGDLYIVHPLATAVGLAQLGMDEATIIAGLLHDVPEDTETTLKDIKGEFGKEIAFLVEGITKLGQLKYRGMDRYVESLRRMFIAMAKDPRVVVIKFADRINNLETLDALPEEKRRRIALESLEIYAPIANRLGMGEIKGTLEDLSFPYVYPEEYVWMKEKVLPEFEKRGKFVDSFLAYLQTEFSTRNIDYISLHGREKHIFSLYKKLLKYNRDLGKIYDFIAIRVVVEDVAKCYETLGVIHELCKPLKGRIKDYIAQPKPNGYQSLHTTVFTPQQFATDDIYGEIVEIQIRTQRMHQEAEFGIASHWLYKEGSKDILKSEKLEWMQQLMDLEGEIEDTAQLMEVLKLDVFQNCIYVFTPRGEVIELPESATPIDFAYKIHTDLGNTCAGVKVNSQIGSLDQSLNNGDVVEIITDPNREGPSESWLQFVITNGAKQRIRQYINKKNKKLFGRLFT